jgi:hypothetical protein
MHVRLSGRVRSRSAKVTFVEKGAQCFLDHIQCILLLYSCEWSTEFGYDITDYDFPLDVGRGNLQSVGVRPTTEYLGHTHARLSLLLVVLLRWMFL